LAAKWIPQGWPYLQPVQDIEAQTEAIRSGFTSRSAVVSEQGEDAEQIDAEQAADNARADRLKLRYASDGRQDVGKKNSSTSASADDQNAKEAA
jgi:capsid protein